METCGLEQLCKMLFGKNVKALGPAAQTLWQLIEDSQEGSKIAQSIQSLGGHKGAVHMLNVEDTDVREQGTALVASLAKCDQETAVSNSPSPSICTFPLDQTPISTIRVWSYLCSPHSRLLENRRCCS